MAGAAERSESAAPQERLDLLGERLAATCWPDEPEDLGRELGADSGSARQLCEHWRSSRDWRG
jgi:hypothetical protein